MKPRTKERRAKRTRKESPAVAGVTSAQKVLAALLAKDDPPGAKSSGRSSNKNTD